MSYIPIWAVVGICQMQKWLIRLITSNLKLLYKQNPKCVGTIFFEVDRIKVYRLYDQSVPIHYIYI